MLQLLMKITHYTFYISRNLYYFLIKRNNLQTIQLCFCFLFFSFYCLVFINGKHCIILKMKIMLKPDSVDEWIVSTCGRFLHLQRHTEVVHWLCRGIIVIKRHLD